MGILAGIGAKTSADEKPEKWEHSRVHTLKPGLGSVCGFGALDCYLHATFGQATQIASVPSHNTKDGSPVRY